MNAAQAHEFAEKKKKRNERQAAGHKLKSIANLQKKGLDTTTSASGSVSKTYFSRTVLIDACIKEIQMREPNFVSPSRGTMGIHDLNAYLVNLNGEEKEISLLHEDNVYLHSKGMLLQLKIGEKSKQEVEECLKEHWDRNLNQLV